MSNRIDLTQFEGMFEGDHPKNLFEEVEKRFKDGGVRTTPLYLGPQYVDAITLLPKLIAELKQCYEELDKWTDYATYVENVNMDCHQDACAEAGFLWKCTDCGAHFELPEDGIYECEFGCDASE